MLLTRFLTAIVLIPLVVAALLWLSPFGLTLLLSVVVGLSAHEWSQFAVEAKASRWLFALICGALVWSWPVISGLMSTVQMGLCGLLLWAALAAWMARYPAGFRAGVCQAATRLPVGLAILLVFAFSALELAAVDGGRLLILVTLVLVWAMDVGGYFFGKQFGRSKLAPEISPNKSWEGFWGGVLLAVVVAVFSGMFVIPLEKGGLLTFTALCVLVGMASVIGDLSESMFKRQAGIKDSGSLLPGHGGLLDRLDSSYCAMPIMLFGWTGYGF